jgi:hypothetical protein
MQGKYGAAECGVRMNIELVSRFGGTENILCDESVSRRGDNAGAKSLEKWAFGVRDCHPTVTRALQLY